MLGSDQINRVEADVGTRRNRTRGRRISRYRPGSHPAHGVMTHASRTKMRIEAAEDGGWNRCWLRIGSSIHFLQLKRSFSFRNRKPSHSPKEALVPLVTRRLPDLRQKRMR
jgi:hypothetical protein